MALQVEIIERSSVIVVTLTGRTDVGTLVPLQDALRIAASEGKTVVLDITDISHDGPLAEIIDALGPAGAMLKLVARPSATSPWLAAGPTEIYPSVEAAIEASRTGEAPRTYSTNRDLAAKFDDLRDRYAQMIDQCRQLLESAQNAQAPAADDATGL